MFEAYHELKSHFLVQVTRSLAQYRRESGFVFPPTPSFPPLPLLGKSQQKPEPLLL